MESSCEQILKWTEKVLNGGAITEEEARTLIRRMISRCFTTLAVPGQHRRYHALRDKAATFTPSACFLRDRARGRLDRCFPERKW